MDTANDLDLVLLLISIVALFAGFFAVGSSFADLKRNGRERAEHRMVLEGK